MKAKSIVRLVILALLLAIDAVLGVLCLFQSCVAQVTPRTDDVFVPVDPANMPSMAPGRSSVPQNTAPISSTPEATYQPEDNNGEAMDYVAGTMGTLIIGRKEISVAWDVDEATLEKSPGWMPQSALPGNEGIAVILGHRNRKHLRPLQDVVIGDTISFRYSDGREYAYIVSEIVIYEDTADWRLPAFDGNTLVLVTCYPFRYSGNAPGKYLVSAIMK